MAEGIDNTQEQKVILKKAKLEAASAPAAQPQVQQTVAEQRPVRTVVRRKLKPVAHRASNSGDFNVADEHSSGAPKRPPVASSTPAASSAQPKKNTGAFGSTLRAESLRACAGGGIPPHSEAQR